jgi:hypothetical protein
VNVSGQSVEKPFSILDFGLYTKKRKKLGCRGNPMRCIFWAVRSE